MKTYQIKRGYLVAWKWGFWFRLFGHGLHVTSQQPFFSERYGFRRGLRVFGWKFERLKP